MATVKAKATEAGVKAGLEPDAVYTVDGDFGDDDTVKPLFQKTPNAKTVDSVKPKASATKKAKASERE